APCGAGAPPSCRFSSSFLQINTRDASGQTPLHLACERGDLACVKELLEESQARTDIKDHNGETPMHSASKQNSPVIIQVKLNRKRTSFTFRSVVVCLNNNGETPLHVACRLGRVEAVKALLGGGAKCDTNKRKHICLKVLQSTG
uniref:Uncharacterized protein n=1 Tax=Oryzias latipes TaxID=8090 RepID=A0A3P9HHS7_ORYLA